MVAESLLAVKEIGVFLGQALDWNVLIVGAHGLPEEEQQDSTKGGIEVVTLEEGGQGRNKFFPGLATVRVATSKEVVPVFVGTSARRRAAGRGTLVVGVLLMLERQ
jgi:hypothetical protein